MSLKSHFEKLGAPLKNARWSWGAVRPADGAVFLRVWQDKVTREDGKSLVEVWRDRGVADQDLGPAGSERKEHLKLVSSGTPCYLVMCRVVDPDEEPRRIKGFNAREVFVGGTVQADGSRTLIELQDRMPVESVKT